MRHILRNALRDVLELPADMQQDSLAAVAVLLVLLHANPRIGMGGNEENTSTL